MLRTREELESKPKPLDRAGATVEGTSSAAEPLPVGAVVPSRLPERGQ